MNDETEAPGERAWYYLTTCLAVRPGPAGRIPVGKAVAEHLQGKEQDQVNAALQAWERGEFLEPRRYPKRYEDTLERGVDELVRGVGHTGLARALEDLGDHVPWEALYEAVLRSGEKEYSALAREEGKRFLHDEATCHRAAQVVNTVQGAVEAYGEDVHPLFLDHVRREQRANEEQMLLAYAHQVEHGLEGEEAETHYQLCRDGTDPEVAAALAEALHQRAATARGA